MTNRIVSHAYDVTDLSEMTRNGVDGQALQNAIGYLSIWNRSYPFVRLFVNAKDKELTALYFNDTLDQPRADYVIGAVYSESNGTFSFHS